jgi:hypothetical protein
MAVTVSTRRAALAARPEQAQITVLVVGGTGESGCDDTRTEVSGMLSHVTAELDHRFTARWVPYPASYGPFPQRDGMSFAESVDLGVANLTRAIAAAAGSLMLIGYSQGCTVIRRVLGGVAAGEFDGDRILAVGLVSDPERPAGTDTSLRGYGIAGQGPTIPEQIPVHWISHPEDVICNASEDSFVRDIADATAFLTLRDLAGWAPRAIGGYLGHGFQNAAKTAFGWEQSRRDLERLRTAGAEIAGYLPIVRVGKWMLNRRGNRHVAYASEPLARARYEIYDRTGCQLLAQWLQVQATFALPVAGSEVQPRVRVGDRAHDGSEVSSTRYRQTG